MFTSFPIPTGLSSKLCHPYNNFFNLQLPHSCNTLHIITKSKSFYFFEGVFGTNWSAISLHTCCSKITTSNFSRSILHNNKPLVSTLIFSKVSHEMKKKKKQIIKIKSKSISHNNKPIVSTLIFPSLVIR